MQPTSLDAFYKIQGRLGVKQQRVLEKFLKWYPMSFSDYDLAKMLCWPINTVTPRRGELCAKDLLECVGHRLNRDTGMENNVWRAKK